MSYNPYGYTPYVPFYQRQNAAPTQAPVPDIIKVHGREGALTLGNSLGPNRACLAIDETQDDIEWLIATDGAGFPTLKRWRFMDADETPKEKESVKEEPPVYVTVEEFDALKSQFEAFVKEIGGTSK